MSMRVLSIVGTRPEAVKMAPVIQALRQAPAIETCVCATAQHRHGDGRAAGRIVSALVQLQNRALA